jgi:hypothetical protein
MCRSEMKKFYRSYTVSENISVLLQTERRRTRWRRRRNDFRH